MYTGRSVRNTVGDKIVRKTHLEWVNPVFKHIFGIPIKFSIR